LPAPSLMSTVSPDAGLPTILSIAPEKSQG
jgi:hypothetical protein